MKSLDKDIEYLKGYKYDNEVKQAIENVLWALKGKDCVIETQSHNEEVLEEYIAKLEKELDTYKKVAEKLAEEWFIFDMAFMIRGKDIHSAKQLLDSARKEVENGNNN